MAGHKHPSYKKIYFLLLILFSISVAGPEVTDLMGLEDGSKIRLLIILFTAFVIALVKAYYVCSYFMHLKFEKIYAPYILLTCAALLFVFFFGAATDTMKSEGHHWQKTFKESDLHHAEHHEGGGEHAVASEGNGAAEEGAAHEAAPAHH